MLFKIKQKFSCSVFWSCLKLNVGFNHMGTGLSEVLLSDSHSKDTLLGKKFMIKADYVLLRQKQGHLFM